MSAITAWIRALAGAAVFCAIALALCPEGRPKRVLRAACGVVMAAALLSPALGLDMQALPEAVARYGEAARSVAGEAGQEADRLNRTIIERECAAYILDKAEELGANVSGVKVQAQWNLDGLWVPYSAEIDLPDIGSAKAALEGMIQNELGIPAERQMWM